MICKTNLVAEYFQTIVISQKYRYGKKGHLTYVSFWTVTTVVDLGSRWQHLLIFSFGFLQYGFHFPLLSFQYHWPIPLVTFRPTASMSDDNGSFLKYFSLITCEIEFLRHVRRILIAWYFQWIHCLFKICGIIFVIFKLRCGSKHF